MLAEGVGIQIPVGTFKFHSSPQSSSISGDRERNLGSGFGIFLASFKTGTIHHTHSEHLEPLPPCPLYALLRHERQHDVRWDSSCNWERVSVDVNRVNAMLNLGLADLRMLVGFHSAQHFPANVKDSLLTRFFVKAKLPTAKPDASSNTRSALFPTRPTAKRES